MTDWTLFSDWTKESHKKEEKKKPDKPRERAAAQELSLKYLYRRAYSEIELTDALRQMDLKPGVAINVITGGNIDQMSCLSFFVRRSIVRDAYVTTWCVSNEDALQLTTWLDEGRLTHLQLFVGEIFKGSYAPIFYQLRDYFERNPDKGRLAIFKCHAKMIAGRTDDFGFTVQTSANMDTNPRTEQGCIQISDESYRFYADYLDNIKSFKQD